MTSQHWIVVAVFLLGVVNIMQSCELRRLRLEIREMRGVPL